MHKPSADTLSYTTNYSPERELPTKLKTNPWACAVWWKKHPSGPVVTVWHLYPLNMYVVGWTSWAGSRVVPKLVDGKIETDPMLVDILVDELGNNAFEAGPSEAMIEESERVSKAFAENGKKGGRGNRKYKTT